jgi:hypothetical protein
VLLSNDFYPVAGSKTIRGDRRSATVTDHQDDGVAEMKKNEIPARNMPDPENRNRRFFT